jgi:hypothetical protein
MMADLDDDADDVDDKGLSEATVRHTAQRAGLMLRRLDNGKWQLWDRAKREVACGSRGLGLGDCFRVALHYRHR